MPLNRNLRPRTRVLPEPPKLSQKNQKIEIHPLSSAQMSTNPEKQFASILEEKIDHLSDEIDAKEKEEFLAARKNLLDELDGIFRQGFDGT